MKLILVFLTLAFSGCSAISYDPATGKVTVDTTKLQKQDGKTVK